ncbi:plasmid replication initiator TrfA [Pseudomonas putida]|uniref:plasmid replication initiator TrfA n=1 Tax=Pseudomonas putida TaxID=303 RepID=UPI002753CDB1|nr:plasmid replication initiator TrfA [Pseudomonas putida]MDP9523891.1 plasmid replication initiator TrfA [Pseudomonas putida]
MSDDNYVLEKIERSASKRSHEQILKSSMHQALFGFVKGETARLVEWPEIYRGMPNAILRSALFGAVGRGERTYHFATRIATLSNVTMVYSGPQLDQADRDVWEQCLHVSRSSELGLSIEISVHPFLKAIGRDTGKSQRDWLKDSFKRLVSAVIEINEADFYYAGHLLHEYMQDDSTGLCYIQINPNIVRLYRENSWTLIEHKERFALKGYPLAQWLHGFYLTHAKALPYKVETIHKLCGSRAKNITDFRKDVRKAFAVMQAAIGWRGEINGKGLITVDRPLSRSQKRHLNCKLPA